MIQRLAVVRRGLFLAGLLSVPLVPAACSSTTHKPSGGAAAGSSGSAGASGSSGAAHDPARLGDACGGACTGAYCFAEDRDCQAPGLDHPCVGTADGLYCSAACEDDADCSGGAIAMRCLVACPGEASTPSVSRRCWSQPDYDYLRAKVCVGGGDSGGAGQGGNGSAGAPAETAGSSTAGSSSAGASGAGGTPNPPGDGGAASGGEGAAGGPGAKETGGAGGALEPSCNEGQRRCVSGSVDECVSGSWSLRQDCEAGCYDDKSCACTPGDAARCVGGAPVLCSKQGHWDDAEACEGFCYEGDCCENHCQVITCDPFGGCTCTGAFTLCGPAVPLCNAGDRRCVGKTPQHCTSGRAWEAEKACSFVCSGAGECSGSCNPGIERCKPESVDVVQECNALGAFVDQPACYYACVDGACDGSCKPGTSRCSDAATAEVCAADGEFGAGMACPYGCYGGKCSTLPDTCGAPNATTTPLLSEGFDGYADGALETVADALWIRSGSAGRGTVGAYTPAHGLTSLYLDRQFDSDGSYYRKLIGLPATPRKLTISLYATVSSDFGFDPGLDFGLAKIQSKFSITRALTVRFREHVTSLAIGSDGYTQLSDEFDYATSGFNYIRLEFDFCSPTLNVYTSKSTPAAATLLGSLPIPAEPAFDAFYMNGTWWARSIIDDIDVTAED